MPEYKSKIDTNHCKNWLLRAYVDSKITGHYVCSHFGMTGDQTLGVVAYKIGLSTKAGLPHVDGGRVIADLDNPPTEKDAQKLLDAYRDYKAERRKMRRDKKNGQLDLGDTTVSIDGEFPALTAQDSLEDKVDRLLEIAEKLAKVWGCK